MSEFDITVFSSEMEPKVIMNPYYITEKKGMEKTNKQKTKTMYTLSF